MTKEELSVIFKEVNTEMIKNQEYHKTAQSFKNYSSSGKTLTTEELAVAIFTESFKLNQSFLYSVLSKALCKD